MEFTEAIAEFNQSGHTCVMQNQNETFVFDQHGIFPLVSTLAHSPKQLSGATVCDRIIGRAAALLCIYGKAAQVYGRVMSEGAVQLLAEHNIELAYGDLVPFIQNREQNGLCPMEQKVQHTADPEMAYDIFFAFLKDRI